MLFKEDVMNELWVGIDVGSTTVKIAVLDPVTRELVHSDYQRHNADQGALVQSILTQAHERFPGHSFRVAFCGSAGEPYARATGSFFIQEVVANTIAIKEMYPQVRVAIELGGQDAKVIFFRQDEKTGKLLASDMRMNGSCAGGTGAFIDQIAELLSVKTEDFNALAARGKSTYDISGRCGVFAKTDIQPLLNQGVHPADIALSSFHAIAKQTIGGLAQGIEIRPPVIFEGGPLTFNPILVEVFKQRLNLTPDQVVVPQRPEIMVALGAALATSVMYGDRPSTYRGKDSLAVAVREARDLHRRTQENAQPFFSSSDEKEDFQRRNPAEAWQRPHFAPGSKVRAYLGIDGGSTTTKFVLLDENEQVVDKFYANNQGDPLEVLKSALLELRESFRSRNLELEILGVGTTGYAENLFATALKADFHTVETVAHARAAQAVHPQASFILDIGGQDMKAIFLKKGVVTGIVLNEACSAGCGSFLETYAKSLKIPVGAIANLAFDAKEPSRLGSRCTVFMNSSIITEQKSGKTPGDIMAGLCRSVIENVFTKVVRVANLDTLGSTIVVQGGTFKNDAVLRAFEQYTGRRVVRPPLPGEMGAIGVALLTKAHVQQKAAEEGTWESQALPLAELENFGFKKSPGQVCPFCPNNCSRTVVTFNDGSHYITGNRCEKGEILGDPRDKATREKVQAAAGRQDSVPDLMKLHAQLLVKDYPVKDLGFRAGKTLGIPRTLEFWASLPYWKGVFRSLGFEVKVSKKSSYALFEQGLANVPSDTACFPAKLSHGHVKDLIGQKVDRIFFPMMVHVPAENRKTKATNMCPLVQGYPNVIDKSDEPTARYGIPFDYPVFHWKEERHKRRQTVAYLRTLGVPYTLARKAWEEGEKAQRAFRKDLEEAGRLLLADLEGTDRFAVVLAGRPYHSDELINHHLAGHFTSQGIPVLSLESLPGIHKTNLKAVRMEAFNPFHSRMLSAALKVAESPHLEMVQIVSFGCGHDAIISDEVDRILKEKAEKNLLILKLDEGENRGPLHIRVKSYIETIRTKRSGLSGPAEVKKLPEAFEVKFTRQDRGEKTILIPNLSPAFSVMTAAIIAREGYKTKVMPLASPRAFELGKKYVHNDICFPAQVNIGEALACLESGEVDVNHTALGLSKNCEDCRAGHYVPLARKALDDAGYPQVPIITTGNDAKNVHPGFKLSPLFQIRMVWGLAVNDSLEMMVRAIRPYEKNRGEADRIFQDYLHQIAAVLPYSVKKARGILAQAVQAFNAVEVDRQVRKPRCGILGEILINFHPTANGEVEKYLESHGMEVVLPSMTDFFRRAHIAEKIKAQRGILPYRILSLAVAGVTESVFRAVGESVGREVEAFRFYEDHGDAHDLMKLSEGLIDQSFMAGEGWLMGAEIVALASSGVGSFVVLNPFGCLPNHVSGRGLIKPLKKMFPHIQILPLDFDPDTSFANVENRLQMLVITAREMEKAAAVSAADGYSSGTGR